MSQIYFFLLTALVFGGCALLPTVTPIGGGEKNIAMERFKAIVSKQTKCSPFFDADVSVSFKKAVYSGAISGFLQGREPALLRFEGVNPLGMTEIIAATDGEEFHLINVRQQKMFSGGTNAEKIKKFAPGRFPVQTSYYWLIGLIPPGPIAIHDLSRDADGRGYWADIKYDNWDARGMVLFSGPEGQVLENILTGDKGEVLARFTYQYGGDAGAGTQVGGERQCGYPEKVTVEGNGRGTISIQIKQINFNTDFDRKDFDLFLPKGFEREIIK